MSPGRDTVSEERRYRKQEQEPARTEVTEVAPGILRMQLPIQMPGLGHVNAYALVDDRGAAIVDPGLPGPPNWRALGQRLHQAGIAVRQVHTVVVTHSHVDHFGTAGRLAREAGAEFVAHRQFHVPWLDVHEADDEQAEAEDPEQAAAETFAFGGPTPWGGRVFTPPMRRRLMFMVMRRVMPRVLAPPVPTRRVAQGEVLKLAGREWFAIHTPGHTLDHLCLHDPEEGVLLSGDHVLPTITPHISGIGTGPDPLAAFLASLDHVAALEGVGRVLPAHGHPFDDLPGRVEEIKEHHRARLEKLRRAATDIGRPASVQELSQRLFRRDRWGFMAESETYAHLEHLRLLGEAERHAGPDRRPRYVVNPA